MGVKHSLFAATPAATSLTSTFLMAPEHSSAHSSAQNTTLERAAAVGMVFLALKDQWGAVGFNVAEKAEELGQLLVCGSRCWNLSTL